VLLGRRAFGHAGAGGAIRFVYPEPGLRGEGHRPPRHQWGDWFEPLVADQNEFIERYVQVEETADH
jgi:hypothetical protein